MGIRVRFRLKKYILAIIIMCGFYIAYPYATLWSISKDIQTHNVISLSQHLNWRSIKDNLSTNIIHDLKLSETQSDDDIPNFGNSFATTTISNAVHTNVDTDHLGVLMDYIAPNKLQPDEHFNMTKAFEIFMRSRIYFTSPVTLHATVISQDTQDPPIEITMQLQKWRWKITAISIPDSLLSTLFSQKER